MPFRHFFSAAILTSSAILASASTPVVSVSSPANGSTVGSPVNYLASASSPSCSKGIAAMRIYTAPGVNAYTINANKLDTNINLPKGTYSTIVQAWDNCGGVGKTTVGITVAKINLPPPRFLYATEFKAGRIAEYVVNPLTGSLTATSQGSTWAHFGPVDIASDHLSTHLYVANQGSHDLDAYFINRTSGNLTQVPGSPFALAGTGQRVAVHPAGHFVYASSITTSGGNVTGVISTPLPFRAMARWLKSPVVLTPDLTLVRSPLIQAVRIFILAGCLATGRSPHSPSIRSQARSRRFRAVHLLRHPTPVASSSVIHRPATFKWMRAETIFTQRRMRKTPWPVSKSIAQTAA